MSFVIVKSEVPDFQRHGYGVGNISDYSPVKLEKNKKKEKPPENSTKYNHHFLINSVSHRYG